MQVDEKNYSKTHNIRKIFTRYQKATFCRKQIYDYFTQSNTKKCP